MPFDPDPYRTLGLAPGASLNEIRSAYRRLAKKYHPDAAGDRALPRFLSIQAAYERLVDGEGRLRRPGSGVAGTGAGGGGGRGSTGGRGSSQEPWRSDASRARASREAWRARRGGGPGTGSADGGGAGREPGGRTSPGGSAGSGRTGGPGRTGGWRPGGEHDRRHTRRATAGSTTYDEAAETPLDPEWDGGAWYGPSSGTYWTINPREYADPRKHGPEYQPRARRAAGLEGGDDEAEAAAGAEDHGGYGTAAPPPSGPDRPANPAPPPARPARPVSTGRRLGLRGLLALARRTLSR
jgi:hypothetical protein